MLDSVYLNREFETSFCRTLSVLSEADSHQGQTLVTLIVDGLAAHLFPREARDLAAALLTAANLADGVQL